MISKTFLDLNILQINTNEDVKTFYKMNRYRNTTLKKNYIRDSLEETIND